MKCNQSSIIHIIFVVSCFRFRCRCACRLSRILCKCQQFTHILTYLSISLFFIPSFVFVTWYEYNYTISVTSDKRQATSAAAAEAETTHHEQYVIIGNKIPNYIISIYSDYYIIIVVDWIHKLHVITLVLLTTTTRFKV